MPDRDEVLAILSTPRGMRALGDRGRAQVLAWRLRDAVTAARAAVDGEALAWAIGHRAVNEATEAAWGPAREALREQLAGFCRDVAYYVADREGHEEEDGYLEAWVQKHTAKQVEGLDKEGRRAVKQAVLRSVRGDISDDEAVKRIKGAIGLSDRQEVALDRYRTKLEDSDEDYTERQLDKLVSEYEDELLWQRAELIAETEATAAEEAAQLAEWRDQQESGDLPEGQQREWVLDEGERTCPECYDLEGQTVGLDELFQSDEGEYEAPPAHPHCRCSAQLVDGPGDEHREAHDFDEGKHPRDSKGMFTDGGGDAGQAGPGSTTKGAGESAADAKSRHEREKERRSTVSPPSVTDPPRMSDAYYQAKAKELEEALARDQRLTFAAAEKIGADFFYEQAMRDDVMYRVEMKKIADAWKPIGGDLPTAFRFAVGRAFGLEEGKVWDTSYRPPGQGPYAPGEKRGGFRDEASLPDGLRASAVVWGGVMRREYQETQQDMREGKGGFKPGQTLYRGTRSGTVYMSTIESWSTSQRVAKNFGATVKARTFPTERVLVFQGARNWQANGMGLKEREVMILSDMPRWVLSKGGFRSTKGGAAAKATKVGRGDKAGGKSKVMKP